MSAKEKKITLDYKKFIDHKDLIDNAHKHLSDNEYEYGPDFRNKEKNYSVNKIETKDNVSSVYFDFAISGFSELGLEYVEIDSEKNVLTRRIEKYPKSKKPLILLSLIHI